MIFFIPNVKSESLSDENINLVSKEKVFNKKEDISCIKNSSDYLICNQKTKYGINFKIKKKDGLLLSEYSINCLEGYVEGTAINNNDKNINEIISESIKKTCKDIPKKKLVLSPSYNLPDSTNKNSELICDPYDLSFSNTKFEVCKAHDNQDNFLIRINDSSKDEILTQITGNCSNPSVQDSYFNKKDVNNNKISLIKEKILPNVKNKICKQEGNKNTSFVKTNFVKMKDPASEAYLKMANARYGVGDLRNAIKEVNTSISINPSNSFAYNSRGKFLRDMGYLNSALIDFDKAIKLNPEIIEFYIDRVGILLKMNSYSEALSDFDRIIALEPKSNIWLLRRGLLKIKQLKYDEALADISKYITFEKNNSLAFRSRGIIYLNFGNFDKACSDLSISKNLNDDKTEKLLRFINSKNPNICNSIATKNSNNSNTNIDDENNKELNIKEVCNKNTFVKFDDKESCFN
ncbi:tetratricopeptide repeat protein [Prochlorococcus marinus]|uniref:tetratricopeptide repeat protein n=1 Tax=Prochlorococcus marinus TaxID=1219 RepID=UPI00187C7D7F|nr:hypothetical protein [Prochlorococcus marinus]